MIARRLRRLSLSLVVAFSSLGPVALFAGPACASGDSAALVIDTGGSVLEYCVKINGTVSGINFIKAAASQYGLDYALGYGGKGVCRLAGIGSASNDCLADDKPNFWGYWRGTGGGGWSWSSVGAASTSVSPGSVEGWAWGSGTSGGSHPQPPNTDYSDVCKEDKPDSGGGGGGSGGGGGHGDDGSAGGGGNQGDDSKDEPKREGDKDDDASNRDDTEDGDEDKGAGARDDGGGAKDDRDTNGAGVVDESERDRERSTGTLSSTEGATEEPSADAAALAAASAAPATEGGSSVAWLGALVLIAGLAAAGWAATKRREPPRHVKKG